MSKQEALIPIERIEQKIYFIRGEKVMLDKDLAELYGVTTRVFNQAIKRNLKRFPEDFMFQLTKEEYEALRFQIGTSNDKSLRSQIVTSKTGRGGRRYLPYVFTEHGAMMAANILNSERAIEASVQVVRAFVKLRQLLASNVELAKKLEAMEKKYDAQFKVVFDAIRKLMLPPAVSKRSIGFIEKKKNQ